LEEFTHLRTMIKYNYKIDKFPYILFKYMEVKEKIIEEYNNWLRIFTFIEHFKNKFQLYSTIERALITHYSFDGDLYVNNAIKQLVEKTIFTKNEAQKFMREFLEFKVEKEIPDFNIQSNGTICVGKFRKKLNKKRLKLLRKFANTNEIIYMVIRYASLFPGGQQWNVPKNVYKLLVEKYGIEIEGFSSPINSQLLPYGLPFCSLFYDTDKPFGSLGNAYDQDFIGKRITLNPPFILEIVEKTVSFALEIFERSIREKKETFIFMILPAWADADFYTSLTADKRIYTYLFTKDSYYYEDSFTGFKIYATFDSYLCILNSSKPYNDYDDIIEQFKF